MSTVHDDGNVPAPLSVRGYRISFTHWRNGDAYYRVETDDATPVYVGRLRKDTYHWAFQAYASSRDRSGNERNRHFDAVTAAVRWLRKNMRR